MSITNIQTLHDLADTGFACYTYLENIGKDKIDLINALRNKEDRHGSFGQDSVKDADGQGRIQINGQTLGKAQGGSGYLAIRLDGKQKSASQTCMRHKASKFIATHAFK